jgi:hypothetical protein
VEYEEIKAREKSLDDLECSTTSSKLKETFKVEQYSFLIDEYMKQTLIEDNRDHFQTNFATPI